MADFCGSQGQKAVTKGGWLPSVAVNYIHHGLNHTAFGLAPPA